MIKTGKIILCILMLSFLVGCTSNVFKQSSDDSEKAKAIKREYPYYENHQYNINSESDANDIYVSSKNKLYIIDKESHQYRTVIELNQNFAEIAMYKDWIYAIESNGMGQNNKVIKISKDGSGVTELLSNALYIKCWIYNKTLYLMNFTNNSLVESYSLNDDGNILNKLNEDNDFLFKSYNNKQNEIIRENIDKSPGFIASLGGDYTLLKLEGYNRLYYNLDIEKEYLNEGGYTWMIKDATTQEELTSLDVFNDRIIIMNGEIAYIDNYNIDLLKIKTFDGKEIYSINMNMPVLGLLNYDKDWIYFYTNAYQQEDNMLCCRINRNTYEIEELFEGNSAQKYFKNYLDVYDGLLIYNEIEGELKNMKTLLYDLNTGEKKYLE